MEFEQLKSQFEEHYEGLLATVKDSLKQLLNQEIAVEYEINEETDLKQLFSGTDFPVVRLQFTTKGANQYQQWLTLPTSFGLKLFSWMVQGEEEESLNEEHLKSLAEGAKQIFGQLQAALDSDEATFVVDDLKLEIVESTEQAAADFPEATGMRAAYTVSTGDESFPVYHYLWHVAIAEEESETEQTAEGNAKQVEASPGDQPPSEISQEEAVGVHPADFESFTTNGGGNGHPRNMDMLLDVGLKVLVELGKKTMLIKDILKLGKGSVVELDKAAGEPLEIFVNGRKLAEGEVVVVDDHFGVRITQLTGPMERIKSLQ